MNTKAIAGPTQDLGLAYASVTGGSGGATGASAGAVGPPLGGSVESFIACPSVAR